MQSGMHGAAMATPLRASSASVGVMGESERRRVILLRLLGEIVAFIKQKQRRQDASTVALFDTVLHACEARLGRLEDGDDGLSLSSSSAMTPRVAVAEAMVQELLVSLVSIRKSETESLVMEEVENVESMRTLLAQLRQDEKSLRRVVTNGAGGGDSQLRELQLLLRDELVQELALVRARGLADSLHADASMQFAWETIHGQKMEIVRLRAENEDLQRRDIASGGAFRVSVMSNIEPKHAIQVLRREIARHHETNIHALQEHLEQLEDALRRTAKRNSHRTKKTKALGSRSYNQSGISETTLDSSREQDRNNDSILLPSHLTNEVDLSVCGQCQQSGKTILGLQSELRQLRAQVAADEDSLVRAQQEHFLMKKEHSALTSALISAKQKQEELRQMIRDISEEKSRIQTLSETKQKTLEHDVEVLRREIATLELKNEQVVRDMTLRRDEIVEFQKETVALRVECDGLRRTVHELQNQLVLTDCELTSTRATTSEVRYTTQTLHRKLEEKTSELAEAQDKCRHIDAKLEEAFNQKAELQKQLEFAQHSTKELARALERSQRDRKDHDNNAVALSQQLQDAKQKLTRLKQENKQLKDEMRHTLNESAQEACELAAARESVRALQHHVAAVEGRLNRTEEDILSQSAIAQAENERCQELRTALNDQRMELQRTHEECQRLNVELKHAVDLKNQLQRDLASLKQDESQIKRDTNSLEQQQIELHKEIEDSKTTILMWMSKYNAVVEGKARLENDAREKLDQAQRDKEELQKARANEAEFLRKKDDLLKEISSAKKSMSELHEEHIRIVAKEQSQALQLEELRVNLVLRCEAVKELESSRCTLLSKVEEAKSASSAFENRLKRQERETKRMELIIKTLEARPQIQMQLIEQLMTARSREWAELWTSLDAKLTSTQGRLKGIASRVLEVARHRQNAARSQRASPIVQQMLPVEPALSKYLHPPQEQIPLVSSSTQTEQALQKESHVEDHSGEGLPFSSSGSVEWPSIKTSTRLSDEIKPGQSAKPAHHKQPQTKGEIWVSSHQSNAQFTQPSKESVVRRDKQLHTRRHRGSYSIVETVLTGHAKSRRTYKVQEDPSVYQVLPVRLAPQHFLGVNSRYEQARSSVPVHGANEEMSLSLLSSRISYATSSCAGSVQAMHQPVLKWQSLIFRLVRREKGRRWVEASQWIIDNKVHKSIKLHEKQKVIETKWSHLVRRVLDNERHRRSRHGVIKAMQMSARALTLQSRWDLLSRRLETMQAKMSATALLIQNLRAFKRGEAHVKAHCFMFWKHRWQISRYRHQIAQLRQHQSRPSEFSSVVMSALKESVRLLHQFCEPTHSGPPSPASPSSSSTSVWAAHDSDSSMDNEMMALLVVESSRYVVQWKEVMERKLTNLHARVAQLDRLEKNCAELKVLVNKYQQQQCRHIQTPSQPESLVVSKAMTGSWLEADSKRRTLNEGNISILEGVLGALQEAKESRVRLHRLFQQKTRQLEESERQLEYMTSITSLMRAFFHWRLRTIEPPPCAPLVRRSH